MARYLAKIFVLALALIVVSAGQSTKCPKILGKYPFDAPKFTGDWHVISGADTKLEGIRCVKVNFRLATTEETGGKPDSHVLKGTYKAIISSSGKPVQIDQFNQAIDDPKSATSYSVYKKEGATEWSSPFKSSIIATDYETYAVLISCQPAFDASTKTFGRRLTAKILARTATLSKDTLSTLTNLLSGYDIVSPSVRLVDQTKCDAVQSSPIVHHSSKPEAADKH